MSSQLPRARRDTFTMLVLSNNLKIIKRNSNKSFLHSSFEKLEPWFFFAIFTWKMTFDNMYFIQLTQLQLLNTFHRLVDFVPHHLHGKHIMKGSH